MKKKSVMMSGANFFPSCPMLAIAMSSRTKSTSPSTAAANPRGAFSPARCRASERPASFIVRKTSSAASARKTTCLVGVRLTVSGPRWVSGHRCQAIRPNGAKSSEYASAVWWRTISPTSTSCPAWIIGSAAPRKRGGGAAPPGTPPRWGSAESVSDRAPPPPRSRPRRGAGAPSRAPSGRGSAGSGRRGPAGPGRARRAGSRWRGPRRRPPPPPPGCPRAGNRRRRAPPRAAAPPPRPVSLAAPVPFAPGGPVLLIGLELAIDAHEREHRADHRPRDEEEGERVQPAVQRQPAQQEEHDRAGEPESRREVSGPLAKPRIRALGLHIRGENRSL